ncbi:MAG: hypothetical protein ACD_38C00001G0007 [uncultured bacterium]|nr:MAG: hypothetical protein ACD_38C00001G0007 [uncultured bacterium]
MLEFALILSVYYKVLDGICFVITQQKTSA